MTYNTNIPFLHNTVWEIKRCPLLLCINVVISIVFLVTTKLVSYIEKKMFKQYNGIQNIGTMAYVFII